MFVCGLKTVLDDDFFDHEVNNIMIVDDDMDDIADNEATAALFSRGIHHRNISVIYDSYSSLEICSNKEIGCVI